MNEIAKYEANLLVTLNELVPYVLIGEEKIKAYTAKLSAVRKLGLSIEIERAALSDTQRMGEACQRLVNAGNSPVPVGVPLLLTQGRGDRRF